MILVLDIYAQTLELSDESANFFLVRVTAQIANVFEWCSAENLVDRAGQPICNCNFSFVGGAKTIDKLVIFGAIK